MNEINKINSNAHIGMRVYTDIIIITVFIILQLLERDDVSRE